MVTFDLPYLAFYYNQKLLIYQSHAEFVDVAAKLKEGLAAVLDDIYQLAGRLGKDDEGVFRVEYDDDDMDGTGVEFSEAAADDSTTAFKDLIQYSGVLNVHGLHRPLLGIQLTKLRDGLAMGLAFNHAILDGTSTWHFMGSWAEICSESTSISVPPFLERTKVRNTRVKLDLSPPDALTKPNNDNSVAKILREKVFKFPKAAIAKIKSTVNSTPTSNG
ncbi:unnamed protein product [Linum tenue]|uniref:BAHD acyltransferase n=1 Tax=Linum tenue TaxID=586396 RepID=A0AAV0J0Z0_9ROSI|nr:unnamed protein product [Linum tenue]